MLTDIECKVLRIILNDWRLKRYTPTIRELQKRTGRSEYDIKCVLEILTGEHLIKWSVDDPESIEIDYHRCITRGI